MAGWLIYTEDQLHILCFTTAQIRLLCLLHSVCTTAHSKKVLLNVSESEQPRTRVIVFPVHTLSSRCCLIQMDFLKLLLKSLPFTVALCPGDLEAFILHQCGNLDPYLKTFFWHWFYARVLVYVLIFYLLFYVYFLYDFILNIYYPKSSKR